MSPRIALTFVLVPVAVIVLDALVWAARGFPDQQVAVDVFTTMQMKGQKEDYGTPETTLQPCHQRLLPTGRTPTCWWLMRHREIVRRY